MAPSQDYIGRFLWVGVGICLAVSIGALAPTAGAADFTVNSTADGDDGSCDPLPGDCTLREAIDDVSAGLGSSIDFDSATFSPGVLTPIAVGSALPAIMGSGTTVDGSGTGVVIDGTLLLASEDGLAFESGAGTALANVTVRSIVVRNFPGTGVFVCGGARPDCSDPLSRTQVSHVTAVTNGGSGIRIDGSNHDRATVTHSYAGGNTSRGIAINAEQDLSRALVSDCTVVFNGSRGIELNSGDDNLNARLTGNTASRNNSSGLYVNAGNRTIRPQLTGNTTSGNTSRGINLNAGDNMEKPKLSENHAAGNGSDGIYLNSGEDFLGGLLTDNVVTGNAGNGININGFTNLVKVKLRDNRAVNNTGHGIRLEGSSNQLKDNVASDNVDDGIRLDGTGQGNKVQGNQARGNLGAGIRVSPDSTDGKIQGNDARGNGTDLVDENGGCDANDWRGNAFVTRSQACIE